MKYGDKQFRTATGTFLFLCLFACARGDDPSKIKQNAEVASLAVQNLTQHDFGFVLLDDTVDRVITIVNQGKATAREIGASFVVSAFTLKGGKFPGTGGSCTSTLSAGATCTVVVTFAPTYYSNFRDSMKLSYHDGATTRALESPIVTGRSISGASGTLDTSFQGFGRLASGMANSDDQARALIILPDQKYLLAGSSDNGTISQIAVYRFLGNGDVDGSFAGGGGRLIALGTGDSFGHSLARQPDGKIVVVGSTQVGAFTQFAVVRLTEDGTLDTTFGSGGKVSTALGTGNSSAEAVAVQSDGKIVVAGSQFNGSNYDFAIVRYSTAGTLDATFGTGGKVSTPVQSGDDYARAVALQTDGRILVAGSGWGTTDNDGALIRYNANGTLDATFAAGGILMFAVSSDEKLFAVALQSDNKILTAGTSSQSGGQMAIFRVNPNGTADSSFGSAGTVLIPVGNGGAVVNSIAVASDGKILLGGSALAGAVSAFAVVRLLPSGTLDTAFGTSGKLTYSFATGDEACSAIAIQQNSKIFAVGATAMGGYGRLALSRIWN